MGLRAGRSCHPDRLVRRSFSEGGSAAEWAHLPTLRLPLPTRSAPPPRRSDIPVAIITSPRPAPPPHYCHPDRLVLHSLGGVGSGGILAPSYYAVIPRCRSVSRGAGLPHSVILSKAKDPAFPPACVFALLRPLPFPVGQACPELVEGSLGPRSLGGGALPPATKIGRMGVRWLERGGNQNHLTASA